MRQEEVNMENNSQDRPVPPNGQKLKLEDITAKLVKENGRLLASIMEDYAYMVDDGATRNFLIGAVAAEDEGKTFLKGVSGYGLQEEWEAFQKNALHDFAVSYCEKNGLAWTEGEEPEEYVMPEEVRKELQGLPNCLIVFYYRDGKYKFVLITDRFCEVLHLTQETVLESFSRANTEFFHPDDLTALRSRLIELVRQPGTLFPFRLRFLVEGKYRWLGGNMVGRALPDGGTLIYVSSVDITQEKEKQAQSETKDLLMSQVLDTTENCMFWKDTERRFVGVNRAFLDFYGFPSEDVLIGKTDEDMGWHTNPDPFRNDEMRVLHGERTYMVHGTCMVHGEERDILATKNPAYDGDKIIGLVGSFIDVTEQYRQQRQVSEFSRDLEVSLDKERQTNQEINQFLSRLSHELRTPMNAVIGLSNLGLEQQDLESMREYLEKIRVSGKYLLQIINEVLEINKSESGEEKLNLSCTSLKEVMGDLHTILDPLVREKGITLTLDDSAIEYDCVSCDRTKLEQILINLLNNAVKFTESGGRIALHTKQKKDGNTVEMVFTIEDNGCGISEEFLPHLFRPFAQENRSPYGYGSGTGLGLAISRTFARMMGGDITARSRIGEGSVFEVTVRLPLCADPVPEPLPVETERTSYPELQGLRVLLAEDNVINREVAHKFLTRVGIDADTAEDGRKVVEIFEASAEGTYDLILMDLQMPFMDGFEAAQAIRALPREDAARVPIIAVSADVFEQSILHAQECGMNGYITKPLEMERLYQEILRHIR